MSVSLLLTMTVSLLSIAYLTLLERKVLSYTQLRKGPNKTGFFQPLADGLKLFSKETSSPTLSNKFLFIISPIMNLSLALSLWLLLHLEFTPTDFNLGLIFFMCLSSLTVYGITIAGWSSNSTYGSLGSYRAIAQMISYEITLALLILFFVSFSGSFHSKDHSNWNFMSFLPLTLIWFSSLLAEVNRSPYDFAEGESELVSGFNVEYGGGRFSLIFLAEYSNSMFMSYLTSMMLFGGSSMMTLIILTLMLWTRASFPRLRYDKLSSSAWKCYLPLALGALSSGVGSSNMSMLTN